MDSTYLRAVKHVPRLCEIGVGCLKIEGRTKYIITPCVLRKFIESD